MLFNLYQDNQEYLQPIATAFKEHIQNQGLELVGKVELTEEHHKEHSKLKEVLASS
jgi:hypothetical protein